MSRVEHRFTTTTIRTPEGLELGFRIASVSERMVAAAFDLTLIAVAFLLGSLLLVTVFGWAAMLLLFFFLRHGYFLWFETRGNGTTFGKRRLHLRVIRADGGPLSVEVLLARNLTREIEFFIPLVFLMAPDVLFAQHHGLVRMVASLWVLLPLVIPYMHPERMRLGDMLAGTRVVVAPPAEMLADLADEQTEVEGPRSAGRSRKRQPPPVGTFAFRDAQLSIYGEKELAVLDDLLRKADIDGAGRALRKAAEAIMRKIGWTDGRAVVGNELEFLRAFYTAQRQHLEQRLLMGERRADKNAGGGGGAGTPQKGRRRR